MTIEFKPWPKIARLNRNIIVTEKIDGTNAAVVIVAETFGTSVKEDPNCVAVILGTDFAEDGFPNTEYHVYAQSRTRFITPGKQTDNYGFAAWVEKNAQALVELLGEGAHYGEWWGSGIQSGYGLKGGERHFSLFNTGRWADFDHPWDGTDLWNDDVPGLGVVPVLYEGPFSEAAIQEALENLRTHGSLAARFDRPEGIVVFHTASRESYKVTLKGDEAPKGPAGHAKDEERAA
ncbi:RNA ligase family protein [Leifsonia aquatica]|uniref:RNA ligase family protein n=1 Tax=Leifsonia aquatica TaxID=144185 RepID=UPI0004688C80|nr:RNA ligase family protein [Leifsonia aquatica]